MTPGLFYRFRVRAFNGLSWGEFSNVLKVGLGPLPSKPATPTKSLDESLGSPTAIMVEWTALADQTLPVLHYSLFMDDGFGHTFTQVYSG
jgi:hypothetical protein